MSSGRFDMEVYSTEKTAAQAQNVMSSLRKMSMSNLTTGSDVPANAIVADRRNSGNSTGSKAKRAIIMQNKQKLRYRRGHSLGSKDSNLKPAIPLTKSHSKNLRHVQSSEDMTISTIANNGSFPDVRLSKSDDTPHNQRHQSDPGNQEAHIIGATEKRLDKYGFILNMDSNGHVFDAAALIDADVDDLPTFAETKLTQRKVRKWNGMMVTWEFTKKRRKRLSKQLRKGIPDSQRGKVWSLLGNVHKKIATAKNSTKGVLTFDDHVRKSLESAGDSVAPVAVALPRMRSESLVQSKSFLVTQETIERDIHRTYPRHNMFHDDIIPEEYSVDEEDNILLDALNDDKVGSILTELDSKASNAQNCPSPSKVNFHDAVGGQAALRRVLRAYSVHDRDVGYCQGMNFIAGMFLTFMSEEEAFWLLVFVMNDSPCRMRGLYGEGMKETHMVLYIAEKLTYQFLPRLAKHMESQSIHITMYATQWLLTLYTSSFQFDLVTRVWDCFLAEGYKVVYRVMLALLQHSQSVLLTLSFEDILAHFREMPKQTDGNEIIEIALKIPLRRKHLTKLQKEYLARQTK